MKQTGEDMNSTIEKIQELKKEYSFYPGGNVITNPGKFEGSGIDAPYFYNEYMNSSETIMTVSDVERIGLDLDNSCRFVYVQESDSGFISVVYFEEYEDAMKYAYSLSDDLC